ncbi:MAG: acyl-CoA reductase [Bacteroidales bacterium]|nr:acyl-CoA reductase [Bacteroidales bacterium]
MMNLNNRIEAFAKLGDFLKALIKNDFQVLPLTKLNDFCANGQELDRLQQEIIDYYQHSVHYNAWFTQEYLLFAISDWAKALNIKSLLDWTAKYQLNRDIEIKTIGVVMAGNLPLVGFHDYLSVLISGHRILAKLSSDDAILLPLLHRVLAVIDSGFADHASFTQGQMKNFDAIIATGSDNTARYFQYYFGKYPNIIRKNRSGVAVITGHETEEQLKALTVDILAYFGLGCRSVSKLFIPDGYEFRPLFEILESSNHLANHSKFFNNYEYSKAIYLVNRDMHRDTGFLLFKEDVAMSSPIAVVYYESYQDIKLLKKTLETRKEEIQCIIGDDKQQFAYGQSQHPSLSDYADGVDTIAFLMSLSA